MYKNPINLIYKDYQTQMKVDVDKLILEATQEVGVAVDKDELIKALNYDRQQYEKGYADGKKVVLDKIRAEIEKNLHEEVKKKYDEESLMYHSFGLSDGLKDALEIIDKYRGDTDENI